MDKSKAKKKTEPVKNYPAADFMNLCMSMGDGAVVIAGESIKRAMHVAAAELLRLYRLEARVKQQRERDRRKRLAEKRSKK